MTLVAGVDSSTQSCKVVIRDAATRARRAPGRAPPPAPAARGPPAPATHPDGSEVDPRFWWDALATALAEAGGLEDVAAVGVGGQQHGMVALDADGSVVRDALLWNDTRSAQAAVDLIAELGDGDPAAGARAWADAIGSVPVASLTVTKLRWLRDHEPELAAKVAAVALPHDWLTWRLAGYGPAAEGGVPDLSALTTDRSDASGTGYWSAATGEYLPELVVRALGHEVVLPRVLGPAEVAQRVARPGNTAGDLLLSPGAGDNAAAALGLGMVPGDVTVSIGTSGVVSAISTHATSDASGMVTGFADATGAYLPLACTLNASRVLDAARRLLGVDHAALSALALSAPAGADGLVLVPYLEGERTPNKPNATGALHGIQLANTDPAHLARAFVEGMLCALADGLDALRDQGVPVERVRLIGGGARSEAVRAIAPAVLGLDVLVPEAGEYVADGAARQAAWALAREADPVAPTPGWVLATEELRTAEPTPQVRERYAAVRDMVADQPA